MKRNYFVMATLAFAILFLASCGGENVTPVSEKIQGPLGKYFEIVSKDYKAKDGKVCIELKRIKAGFPEPWTEGMEVGYSDGYAEPQFIAEFQDADGSVVSKDETNIINDQKELSAVAALEVDETASITFEVSDGASQVKVGSTFKVNGEVESTVNLSGNIGKYPIQMTMHIASNGEVTGAYYYKSKGPGNYLYVKGRKNGDQIILDEYTKDGEHTGEYTGKYTKNIYKGLFKAKSGEYQFMLSPDNAMQEIDLSIVRFSDFSDSSESIDMDEEVSFDDVSSSASGSEDWDALLDAYDSYVTKYIAYAKKIAKGDVSALSEYSDLMSKTQEFSEKMGNAKGEMSPSQLARYMKITTKLSKAAAEMRK